MSNAYDEWNANREKLPARKITLSFDADGTEHCSAEPIQYAEIHKADCCYNCVNYNNIMHFCLELERSTWDTEVCAEFRRDYD